MRFICPKGALNSVCNLAVIKYSSHFDPICLFLIGNKADLDDSRLIDKEQALQLQKEFDFDLFMETSAKTGFNTQELFAEAGKLLYKEYSKFKKKEKLGGEKLKKEGVKKTPENKKKCC